MLLLFKQSIDEYPYPNTLMEICLNLFPLER